MATLAIRGHATRGKEVIEILEMLGGNNRGCRLSGKTKYYYYIGTFNFINYTIKEKLNDSFIIFTLEEFLEKFPYKVGDKVIVKERDKIVTITDMDWRNGREIIYETLFKDDCYECFSAEDLQPYKEQESMEETIKIDIPNGYEFAGVDDDKQQVVFEKIKPQYPKTYRECAEIVEFNIEEPTIFGYKEELLDRFQKLLICRDAYWKLAGDWKPKFIEDSRKYVIFNYKDEIVCSITYNSAAILAFPTEEMRDAFYENFKDIIEQCKELL